jgi:molybdopterin-biosynthesis enzyme MoeA-like protein
MTTVEEFFAHHGVKGMKWGVRKNRSGPVQTVNTGTGSEKAAVQLRANSKQIVGVTPGHKGAPADDAVKAAVAKALIKEQSIDVLSNKELQHLVNRMNLEQQYSRMNTQKGKINAGQNVVKQVLGTAKTAADVYNTVNSPAGKALRSLLVK